MPGVFYQGEKKGSSNWHKQRIKVARLHEKITNARTDYLHKGTQAKYATSCGNTCMTNVLFA